MHLVPKTTEDKSLAKRDHHHLRPKPQRRLSRRHKAILSLVLFLSWALLFVSFSSSGNLTIPAPSSPTTLPLRRFSCRDSFWPSAEDCGTGGVKCLADDVGGQPGVLEATSLAFHCPANCVRDASPDGRAHLVGDQDVTGRPVVIGGPIYRGDSALCAAAVHAGVLDDASGGCGVVRQMGQTNSFPSSRAYGVGSLAVKTYFPSTFNFPAANEALGGDCASASADRGWALPWVSAGHAALFFQVTASTAARAVWLATVAMAHLLRWSSGGQPATPRPDTEPGPVVPAVPVRAPVPVILEPQINKQTVTNHIANITFRWATPTPLGTQGISMLVDDVERERLLFKNAEGRDALFWERGPQAFVDYIRFGYVRDGKVLRYSPAGTWLLDGSWTGIERQSGE